MSDLHLWDIVAYYEHMTDSVFRGTANILPQSKFNKVVSVREFYDHPQIIAIVDDEMYLVRL